MKKLTLAILLLLFCTAEWTEAQITGKPGFGKFAITNGDVHTITNGVIEGGVVLVEDHTITYVGNNARITDDYEVIDATGLHVYPGFIDSRTNLGLNEVSSVSMTVDVAETGDYNPHIRAFTAINPHSASIPVTRVSGVTTVVTIPESGVIAGKGVLFDLWGYSPDEMAVEPSSGLHIEWPGAMRRGWRDDRTEEEIEEEYREEIDELNDFWAKAEFYNRMMTEAGNGGNTGNVPDKDLKMEAMREVVSGEIPVIISVNRKKDILNALEWTEEHSELDFILFGVTEGWRVAEEIAEAGIPVVAGSIGMPTRDYDAYDKPYRNAALMAEAGVKVLIGTGDTENVRNAPFHAGYAAAYGMGTEEALKALTIYPAEVWGVDDRLGSIEEGKQANLFISDGDPLEPATQILQVFIKGFQIPMDSRHIQLYEEFLDRDAVNR